MKAIDMPRLSPFRFGKYRVSLLLIAIATLFVALPMAPAAAQSAEQPAEKPASGENAKQPADAKTDEKKSSTEKSQPKADEKKDAKPSDKPDSKPADKPDSAKKPDEKKQEMKKSSDAKPEQPKPEEPKPEEPKPKEPTPDEILAARGVWTFPPTQGDAAVDYSLIGEYTGELLAPASSDEGKADESKKESASKESAGKESTGKPFAVQVRTLGNGQFEARAYEGGLPGQDGFDAKSERVLIGKRSGETLVLSGGPWAMFVSPSQCKIIDSEGNRLADLPRLERTSPTLGAAAPEGAVVLFDGSDTKAFIVGEMTPDGLLKQGADINFLLNDFDLHAEFRIPFMPKFSDQKRGNSGFYLQSRYECQVLDSFADVKVFNGLGALYRYKEPQLNMALPPLAWQTYDIRFTAARYGADGKKLRNARVTSWVNGVKVHDDVELKGPTGAGKPEDATPLPTKIQDHSDPVRFRNIWVIDRGITGNVDFPVMVKTEKPAEKEDKK